MSWLDVAQALATILAIGAFLAALVAIALFSEMREEDEE